ncbi:bifunctional folylpolyglutamate synthase/dihydrofolate synthase [Modestobacter sp. VKM Ac-2979]|uniref:bifunctional folylpolyglutamate synthase/dihydrofolate synthase n=1 Tax=unclassified Modestobacter TaxID=2643866 RepID=UPI0022AB54F1|nr:MULTISPECIES: folylpolyglutamate synthase/dihydrofolate synthase family protein [unclassified Modestobacter]MCZ2809866.1 bifunctional folylpolyglutamate synthase/dihydrofolate synthase [Modestobacter sp. VKM Ac-2979]MCZ2842719.1 bifunctional folylpolyglutamate synthase/dihydrofolate synthase [Modestobacter sp. VKM Ac-2980]
MSTSLSRDLARVEQALLARWPENRLEPSLTRISALVDLLGSPHRAMPVVQVTGTNGKTTTARMVDELLRGFGLRVGRFTSPHLESMRERIVLDGEPLPAERFVEVYDDIAPYVQMVDAGSDVPMSFFEVMVAMAYAAFAEAPVDVAVVEVGMGGTWDATTVADARVAVVTPVSLDHAEYLGPDVATIATEKAGIIKPSTGDGVLPDGRPDGGVVAVLAHQPAGALEALVRRAIEVDATVAREGTEFGVLERRVAVGGQQVRLQGLGGEYDEVFLPLFGAHQAQNAAVALAAVEAFLGAGSATGPVAQDVVRESFAAVRSPGRLERVRTSPAVLVDAAHNPAGMAATVEAVRESFDFTRLVGVVGCVQGKDVTGMLAELEGLCAELVVTQNSSPRAIPADELGALAVDVFGADRVSVHPLLTDALESAIELAEAGPDDALGGSGVLVTGSVVTAGEARALLSGAQR